MKRELDHLGRQIGDHIRRQYPFPNSTSAAIALVNFIPRGNYLVYEEFQGHCMDTFLKAYICSILEKQPNMALREMVPQIQARSLTDFFIELDAGEFPLAFSDCNDLEQMIRLAINEFENALEEVAFAREDAKMILVFILSRTERGILVQQ